MSQVRIHLVMLAALIAPIGCTTTADISAPLTRASYALTSPDSVIAPRPTTVGPQLVLASKGLLYTSESDYPFVYVHQARVGSASSAPLTVAEFRSVFGVSPGTPVEVISLDDFFARHIERVDPFDDIAQARIPRYVNLRETLRSSLSQVVVFRVGRIAIGCYVIGLDANGDLAGLTTISIET